MWLNSVHGRHFVLVADGRLRASDKITVGGGGAVVGLSSMAYLASGLFSICIQSKHCSWSLACVAGGLSRCGRTVFTGAILHWWHMEDCCQQYKMAPVNTVRPPATQAIRSGEGLTFEMSDIVS